MATLAENLQELEDVKAAIRRITGTTTAGGAQQYGSPGNSLIRADLKTLYARRAELEQTIERQVAQTNGGNIRIPIFEGTR